MKKLIRAFILWLIMVSIMVPTMLVFAQEATETVATGDVKSKLLIALVTAVAAFLTAIAGVIGTFLGKLLNRKIKDIDNDLYQKGAYVAVRWVLDAHKKLTGSERYNKAMEKMAAKFPGANKDDLDAAVRSMFINLKAELGPKAKAPTK